MRRKNEEMAAANKKLKELGVLDTEVASSKISNRERSLAYDHSLKGNLKRVTTMVPVLETASACSMSSSVEQAEAMLDQEIDKLLKMKEARVLKDKQVLLFLPSGTIKHSFVVIFFSNIFSVPLTQLTLKDVVDLDSLVFGWLAFLIDNQFLQFGHNHLASQWVHADHMPISLSIFPLQRYMYLIKSKFNAFFGLLPS
jgi:hypothetical protein